MNFKRAEFELKKSSIRTRVEFRAEPILIEPSRAQTSSTRLDSFPALPRCNSKEESMSHAFMHCPKIEKVWFCSSLGINFSNDINISFPDWLTHIILTMEAHITTQIVTIAYNIWHNRRNLCLHEAVDLPEEEIARRSRVCIEEYQQANMSSVFQRL